MIGRRVAVVDMLCACWCGVLAARNSLNVSRGGSTIVARAWA